MTEQEFKRTPEYRKSFEGRFAQLRAAFVQVATAVEEWLDEHGVMVGRTIEWVILAAVALTVASTCLG